MDPGYVRTGLWDVSATHELSRYRLTERVSSATCVLITALTSPQSGTFVPGPVGAGWEGHPEGWDGETTARGRQMEQPQTETSPVAQLRPQINQKVCLSTPDPQRATWSFSFLSPKKPRCPCVCHPCCSGQAPNLSPWGKRAALSPGRLDTGAGAPKGNESP